MSLKAARILHVVASALFVLALLASSLAIVFQEQIKMLYTADPEVIAFRSAPIGSILGILLRLLIAMAYMILLFALKPSKGGSIAVVIVFAVLLLLDGVLITPVIGLISQAGVNSYGTLAVASYSIVSRAASTLSSLFAVPANVLMVISMGGYWGQSVRKKGAFFPAGPQNL